MRCSKAKAGLVLLVGVLALGLLALTWAVGPGSSEAQQDTMHNCPQPGKWAISVWSGADDTDAGQALATCGAGVVDFAYYLDPVTNGWLGYFEGRPEVSKLLTLDNMQGVLAHGAMVAPTPSPTPTTTPLPSWTGVWDTTYGNMELTQSNGNVTGTYDFAQGSIQGTVQGNKLIGTWIEGEDSGEFEFTLSTDGDSFSGGWRSDPSDDWSLWTGTRVA